MRVNVERYAGDREPKEAGSATGRGRRLALAIVLGFAMLAGAGLAVAGIRGAVMESSARRAAVDAVRRELNRLAVASAAPELSLEIVENSKMTVTRVRRGEAGERTLDVVVDMPLVNRGAYMPSAYDGEDPVSYLNRLREACAYAIEANLAVPNPETTRYQVTVTAAQGRYVPKGPRLAEMIGRIAQDQARTWESVYEKSDAKAAIADLLLPEPGTAAFEAFVESARAAGMDAPDLEARMVPLLAGIREVYEATGDGVEGFVFEQMDFEAALKECSDAVIDEISADLRMPVPGDEELNQRLLAVLMDRSVQFHNRGGAAKPGAITYRLEDLYGGPMGAPDCLRWVRAYMRAFQEAAEGLRARAAELPRLVAREAPKTAVLSGKSSGQAVDIVTREGTGQHFLKFYKDGECVMTAFVREGESLRLKLPAGTYRLRIGAGEQWYGEAQAFYLSGVYREMEVKLRSGRGYKLALDTDTANLETFSLSFARF